MSRPPVIEIRLLTWPGGEERVHCERISATRFRLAFATETLRSFRLDGVEVVSVTVGEENRVVSLDLELAQPLDAIRFIPYRSHAPEPGQISFESALERAEAVGLPVDQSGIAERIEYWLFPVFQRRGDRTAKRREAPRRVSLWCAK